MTYNTFSDKMASAERPLLARQNSDASSHGAEVEDALLTGQPTYRTENRNRRWREIGAWSWAAISTVAVIILAVLFSKEKNLADKRKEGKCGPVKKHEGKRNLVFMVSDGMGPASLEMTRSFRQYTENLPWDDILTLDQHLIGTSRTRSSSSWVTDSAAGATAFSCGFKSYNGAISVLPDHTPCGTVLEAAKRAGYMTGLVATTLITDATPACFASHVQTRAYEDLIAEQLLGYYPLGRMVDIIIGGGRCHFLPNTTEGSCRADNKDLVGMAKKDGWTYVDNKKDLMNLDPKGGIKLPLLALMADTNIPFEIDRRHVKDEYPSQLEMASIALDALKAATVDNEKGFFIMIEGSRVDHAGHNNDPAAQVHEVRMHDKTFKAALKRIEEDDTPGVLLSTSDHETGGLSAARQLSPSYPQYLWYPEVLANATNSAEFLGNGWRRYLATKEGLEATKKEKTKFLQKSIKHAFGFSDATEAELNNIIKNGLGEENGVSPTWLFSELISKRAQIGWSTHGHSGVDVNIYGSDPVIMSKVVGNHENIEIGRFMAEYLGVDVPAITVELNKKKFPTEPSIGGPQTNEDWEFAWTGPKLGDGHVEDIVLDGYHTELRP